MSILDGHKQALDVLAQRARTRSLIARNGADFASNDYLGLSGSQALRNAVAAAIERGVAIGAGGSRLLRGNDPEHEALEAEAAAFFGSEASLWFSSGFAANSAIFATLPAQRDLIVHDALIHASAHEGMRLGRATTISVAHNDPQAFADAIGEWRAEGGKGRAWIAVESLYSMDGDVAPLAELGEIAAREDAFLVIDEAHATGVFGPDGRGLAADLEGRENVVTLRTCGKALGTEGALVCAARTLIDTLVSRARGFVFSTAPSPLMAAATRASLRLLVAEPERRAQLRDLISHAAPILPATGSQIVPFIIGDDARTMEIAAALQTSGYDVRGIRPPTVRPGTSRLRISLTNNVTREQVSALAARIEEIA